jgi:phage shock protein A
MGSIIGGPISGGGSTQPQPAPYQPPQAYPPQGYPPQPQAYPPQPTYLPAPAPTSGGWKIPVLFVAVAVLLIGFGIMLYSFNGQMTQLRSDMNDRLDALDQKIAQAEESSNVSVQTSRRNVDNLKKELAAAQAQASQLAGQAKQDASRHADELAAKLQQAQAQEAQRVTAVAADVSQVKDQATATQGQVGQVSGQVDNLKTEQASTKQQLEKTIADLKSARGDLDGQGVMIATNGKELAALRALGERNYTEFRLAKEKKPTKEGDVMVKLVSADVKKQRYSIELIADDKPPIEKKDRYVNEPLQFYLSRAAQPYELVVNEVRKDMIVGYISAPKVQQSRKAASGN